MKPDYDAVENFKNSNHEYVGEGAIYIHNTTIPVMIAKVTGCGCCSSEYQLTKKQALDSTAFDFKGLKNDQRMDFVHANGFFFTTKNRMPIEALKETIGRCIST